MLDETLKNRSTGWSATKRSYQRERLKERKARQRWKKEAIIDNKAASVPRCKLQPPGDFTHWYYHAVIDLLTGERRHWYAVEVAQALDITEHRADRALRQLWGAGLVIGYQWRARRVNGKRVNYWKPNTYIISKRVKTVTL